MASLEDTYPGWSNAEIIQGYKDEDAHLHEEKDTYNPKDIKNLEKHLDEGVKGMPASTKDIDSHPDSWLKHPGGAKGHSEGFGYIYNEEGDAKFGNLNEEGKFIFKKDEIVDDKDEVVDEIVDNKIEIDGGEALNTIVKNDLENLIIPKKKPKSAFANFTENVGSAFENIATALPKKMEEVWADKDRKRMFLRGLEIINSSSGIKPLGQAKSPLGMISEGLLKAEGKFTAEDIAWYKAQNPERKFMGGKELSHTTKYDAYSKAYEAELDKQISVDTRFNAIYKLAIQGKDPPTGIISSALKPLEKIISELGMDDKYNNLLTMLGKERKDNALTIDEKNLFKEIFQAATFEQVVGEAKKLYPVSNKDLEILKATKGDISTNPDALRVMVSADKAISEIAKLAHSKSFDMAFPKDGSLNTTFRQDSQEAAALELSEKFKSEMKPEELSKALVELYGVKEAESPFQLINAYYYNKLQPKYANMEAKGGFYETWLEKEIGKEKDIEKGITDIILGNTSNTSTTSNQ